jgi:farnesyl-diphosphate farnesyltransferase
VAGSVGEFWTKLCLRAWTRYSRTSAEKIILLGTQYGKGLQLVNILRDYPQDLRLGRSYLPVKGALSEDPNLVGPIFQEWRSVAQRYLESGAQYVRAIRPIRVRFACALPVLIGIETLGKMRNIPSPERKIKVSRGRVYWLMLLSLLIAAVPGCDKVVLGSKF